MSERIVIREINPHRWSVTIIDTYDNSVIDEYFTESKKAATLLMQNLIAGTEEDE